MSLKIGDSTTSLILRSLHQSTNRLNKALTRLSTGSRINKASDDAAGLAIAEALKADAAVNKKAVENLNQGLSFSDVAQSSLQQINNIDVRLAELATQSANGTLSDTQRAALQEEANALVEEKNRILQTSEFNGVNVFSGAQLEAGGSQVSIPAVDTSEIETNSFDISTQAAAQAALDSVSTEIENVTAMVGQIGAAVSRINTAASQKETEAVNALEAEARIRDANIAEEVANMLKEQIVQKADTAMLAQSAKLNAKVVNDLLK